MFPVILAEAVSCKRSAHTAGCCQDFVCLSWCIILFLKSCMNCKVRAIVSPLTQVTFLRSLPKTNCEVKRARQTMLESCIPYLCHQLLVLPLLTVHFHLPLLPRGLTWVLQLWGCCLGACADSPAATCKKQHHYL